MSFSWSLVFSHRYPHMELVWAKEGCSWTAAHPHVTELASVHRRGLSPDPNMIWGCSLLFWSGLLQCRVLTHSRSQSASLHVFTYTEQKRDPSPQPYEPSHCLLLLFLQPCLLYVRCSLVLACPLMWHWLLALNPPQHWLPWLSVPALLALFGLWLSLIVSQWSPLLSWHWLVLCVSRCCIWEWTPLGFQSPIYALCFQRRSTRRRPFTHIPVAVNVVFLPANSSLKSS